MLALLICFEGLWVVGLNGLRQLRNSILFGALLWCQTAFADGLALQQPAPNMTLHALNGQTYAVSALRGKVVVLVFWATWCDGCREEMSLLSDWAAKHANQGVQFLGFSLDDAGNLPQVQAVAQQLSFPVGLLGGFWAGDYGRIWRVPVNFVINRQGALVYDGWDHDGAHWNDQDLKRYVTPWL